MDLMAPGIELHLQKRFLVVRGYRVPAQPWHMPVTSLSCSLTLGAPNLEGQLKMLTPGRWFRRKLRYSQGGALEWRGHFLQQGIMSLQTESWGRSWCKRGKQRDERSSQRKKIK